MTHNILLYSCSKVLYTLRCSLCQSTRRH